MVYYKCYFDSIGYVIQDVVADALTVEAIENNEAYNIRKVISKGMSICYYSCMVDSRLFWVLF